MIKHFTLVSLIFAFGAFGLSAESGKYSGLPHQKENIKNIKGTTDFRGHEISLNSGVSSRLSTRAEAPENIRTEVITDAPGKPQLYSKDCGGTTVSWLFGGIQIYERNYPADIYWDGDDAYFANILHNAPYFGTTYVKGKKQEGKVTLEIPQTVIWYDDEQYGYNLVVLKLNENVEEDGNSYVWDRSVTSFDYVIDEEGNMTMALPKGYDGENIPEQVLGLVYTDAVDPDYDGNWTGFCDMYQDYNVFDYTPVTMPEDAVCSTYALKIGEYGYPVSVAFYGEDIYFQGMSQAMPEAVVKGSIYDYGSETGKLRIDIQQDQYLGIYNNETFVFTKKVYVNPDFDPEDSESIYLFMAPEKDPFELYYDPTTETFATGDKYFICFNSGLERISYVDLLDAFTMGKQDDFYGTPANPYNLSFDDTQVDAYGFSTFYFTIPCITAEGKLLDTDNIYYTVYIDETPLEFVEDYIEVLNGYDSFIYWDIAEETDRLAITFDNMWDVYKYSNTDVGIGLYYEGMTTLGVQTIYTYGDKTVTSEIVTLDLDTGEVYPDYASVKEIDSNARIVRVDYYDLNGMRVSEPGKGIFVKKLTFSDGRTLIKKINKQN